MKLKRREAYSSPRLPAKRSYLQNQIGSKARKNTPFSARVEPQSTRFPDIMSRKYFSHPQTSFRIVVMWQFSQPTNLTATEKKLTEGYSFAVAHTIALTTLTTPTINKMNATQHKKPLPFV